MQMATKDPQAQPVSDEERRKRAEEMIMKFAQMMDLGEDDESYGEGDAEEWENMKNSANTDKDAK